jgi:hypothetical protein
MHHDAKDQFAFPPARGRGDFGFEAFRGCTSEVQQCGKELLLALLPQE